MKHSKEFIFIYRHIVNECFFCLIFPRSLQFYTILFDIGNILLRFFLERSFLFQNIMIDQRIVATKRGWCIVSLMITKQTWHQTEAVCNSTCIGLIIDRIMDKNILSSWYSSSRKLPFFVKCIVHFSKVIDTLKKVMSSNYPLSWNKRGHNSSKLKPYFRCKVLQMYLQRLDQFISIIIHVTSRFPWANLICAICIVPDV